MHHCSCSHGIVGCELIQPWYRGLWIIPAMVLWVVYYCSHDIVGCELFWPWYCGLWQPGWSGPDPLVKDWATGGINSLKRPPWCCWNAPDPVNLRSCFPRIKTSPHTQVLERGALIQEIRSVWIWLSPIYCTTRGLVHPHYYNPFPGLVWSVWI